ncbi:GRASP55/65 PDZ-like domain-containing protein [Chytriomyces cf. hyalinus JEL632]|nr:GRASP55/65 PDZ-like domain-containing protein [Chytriomyces cf. hyalinus JEL632]
MGITVRMCALRHARERVWRVLNVLSNSPAEDAGLHPSSDYIIGATEADSLNSLFPLKDRDDLFRLVESRIGSYVSLTVYSSVLQSIRVVVLSPRFDWGGPGCMGCDIGYGPHHRIPVPVQSEKSIYPMPHWWKRMCEQTQQSLQLWTHCRIKAPDAHCIEIIAFPAQQDSHSHSHSEESHSHGHGHGHVEHVDHGRANSHGHGNESSNVEHGHDTHGIGHEAGHDTHGHDSHGHGHENGHDHDSHLHETNLGNSNIHASHGTHGHGHESGHEYGHEHGHEHAHKRGNHDNHDHNYSQSVHGNDAKTNESVHVDESEVYAPQPVSQPVTPVDAHNSAHGHGHGKNHGHGHSH